MGRRRITRSACGSSGANSRTQVSPVPCAAATSPSTVTISPTCRAASCHGTTGGAAAPADVVLQVRPRRPRNAALSLAVPPAHAAPAATAARGALPSLAHGEGAAPERLAVERVDGRLRLGVRRHLDEGKAPGPAGLTVGHDLDLLDL